VQYKWNINEKTQTDAVYVLLKILAKYIENDCILNIIYISLTKNYMSKFISIGCCSVGILCNFNIFTIYLKNIIINLKKTCVNTYIYIYMIYYIIRIITFGFNFIEKYIRISRK
jgi:hypothetical protein